MACLLLVLTSYRASAQEEDIDLEFELLAEEDIVYSAAKHEQDIAESPSAITVITREQIENTHCTDVVCLLRLVPEVDVRIIMPSYSLAGARSLTDGFWGDKALLVLDGREINLEFMGIPLWQELPLALDDIERIEVIRGPGSALYGPNAHSMVVSLTSRKMEDHSAEVFVGAGEYDRQELSLRVGQRLGNFRLLAAVGRTYGDSWREKNEQKWEINRTRLRVDYQGESSTTSLDLYWWTAAGRLLTAIAPGAIPKSWLGHAFLTHQRDFITAKVSLSLVSAELALDLPLYFGDVQLGKWPDIMPFFTSSLDSEIQLNWSPFEGNLLIGGVSHRWVAFISENNDPKNIFEHRLGVFAHVEQRLFDQLILTGSARLDINSVTPMAFSPRLAAVWRFTPSQLVRAAFGRAFRKPSIYNSKIHVTTVEGEPGFEGLGEFIQNSIGNEDLGNESITTFEVGYRGHFLDNRLVFEADVFFNMYRNTINFYSEIVSDQFGIPDLNNSFLAFMNKGQEVNSAGGSVSLTYRLKESLRLNANYTYRYSWYITDPAAAAEFGKKGDRVNWEPEHLINFAFHYLTKIGLRFGLSAHGQTACKMPFPEQGGLFDDQIQIESPARIFFNGFLSWHMSAGSGEFEAGVRAYNLLHIGFRDTPAITRWDGKLFGGELLGRMIFLFVRGSI